METKFQTSFIPKKPITTIGGAGTNFSPQTRSRKSHSVFFSIALLIFIISLGIAGGAFAWESITISNQDALKQQLRKKQEQFNTSLIADLKRENVKIDMAKKLMENHLALSNIFAIISSLTTERVRFNSLELTAPNAQSKDITISMKGVGADLSAVAFQSDVLSKLDQFGLRKIVKNPILSDPTLDTSSMVSFGFSAAVDPATLLYANGIQGTIGTQAKTSEASSVIPPTTVQTQLDSE